jgi:hypothetical protein
MGRGRQRAKDAKIARQLKYANNGSDLRALERELVAGRAEPPSEEPQSDQYPDPEAPEDDYDEWDDEER